MVTDVKDGFPAAKAGVAKGDFILKLDGKAIKNAEFFRGLLETKCWRGDHMLRALQGKAETLRYPRPR